MANIEHLTKLAESYHLTAIAQQQQKLEQYFATVNQNIAGLATGLVTAITHLLSKPKYRSSTTLKHIKEIGEKLVSAAKSANIGNAVSYLHQYNELIGSLTFYASSANSSTGYDPIVNTREDGYTDPAYYIENIDTLNRQLQSRYQQQIPSKSNYIA